jgi:hypothetical protein
MGAIVPFMGAKCKVFFMLFQEKFTWGNPPGPFTKRGERGVDLKRKIPPGVYHKKTRKSRDKDFSVTAFLRNDRGDVQESIFPTSAGLFHSTSFLKSTSFQSD